MRRVALVFVAVSVASVACGGDDAGSGEAARAGDGAGGAVAGATGGSSGGVSGTPASGGVGATSTGGGTFSGGPSSGGSGGGPSSGGSGGGTSSGGSGGGPSNGGSGGGTSSGGSGGGPSSGGSGGGPSSGGSGGGTSSGDVTLPPGNASFDYQLGGAYPPPTGVTVVSRDRTEQPPAGLYGICYVNGFQVQPGEESTWDADLLLRDSQGQLVVDPDWNEVMLDVGTPEKRARIAAVLSGWIRQCAASGYSAVEIDNLDTYSRSSGLITQDDAVALMASLSAAAHAEGLAIAQKNSTDLCARRAEMGTDFAVAEECSRYDECGVYVQTYGANVLMIEYRRADFDQGCATYGATHSIVLRDVDLVPAGAAGYVFEGC